MNLDFQLDIQIPQSEPLNHMFVTSIQTWRQV